MRELDTIDKTLFFHKSENDDGEMTLSLGKKILSEEDKMTAEELAQRLSTLREASDLEEAGILLQKSSGTFANRIYLMEPFLPKDKMLVTSESEEDMLRESMYRIVQREGVFYFLLDNFRDNMVLVPKTSI